MTRGPARGPVRGLWRREDGFVLVFAAVLVPALVGLVGLAVDGARLMSFDTQLAAAADAAALAAAGALDRTDAAIPRARAAAEALLNGAAFSRRNRAQPRLGFRFARDPADLRGDPDDGLPDAQGARAGAVEVTTAEHTLTASLLQVAGVPVRRRAVAQAQYYACDVTPLALCHPDPERFAAGATPGRQYLLRMDGTLEAGSLALLDRPDEGGRTTIRNLAAEAPAFCYADGVSLRLDVQPLAFDQAVNTRFDRYYDGVAAIPADLSVHPPAPVIVQGRALQACTSPPTAGETDPPYHLPRDMAYRVVRPFAAWDAGLGDWKTTPAYGGLGENWPARGIDEYVAWNHADKAGDHQARLREAPTRWDLYLSELGRTRATEAEPVRPRDPALSRTAPTGGPGGALAFKRESPVPVCYPGVLPATSARRRILYLAVTDCRTFTPRAGPLSAHVAKVFLTEPASGGAVLVEMVGMLRPHADDGRLHPAVQLVETR